MPNWITVEDSLKSRERAVERERERIIKWVKDNRREFEIEDGVFFYRDSFQSEDLIAFIKGERE